MLTVSGVCLFDVGDITFDSNANQYCFQAYDVNTGLLWYTARCSKEMYDKQFANLEKRPYHLFFDAKLVDVPLLMDYVGPIPEARQRLDIVDCMVLPSDVHVPQGFVNRARVTMLPYTFEPGPKAGYYLIKMTGASRFVVESRKEEEEQNPADIADDDFDLGVDDFEEVTEPRLSTFDADTAAVAEQSTARSSVALIQLQKREKAKRAKEAKAKRTEVVEAKRASQASASTSAGASMPAVASTSAGPSMPRAGKQRGVASSKATKTASSKSSETAPAMSSETAPAMSVKKAGKQPAVDLVMSSLVSKPSTSQSPLVTQPSSSTTTEQTTSGSSGIDPDYLGLYQDASGTLGVLAAGEFGGEPEEAEDTDVEESADLFTVLKRRRTRDTQSSISEDDRKTRDRKKSKTVDFLKQLQKRAKK